MFRHKNLASLLAVMTIGTLLMSACAGIQEQVLSQTIDDEAQQSAVTGNKSIDDAHSADVEPNYEIVFPQDTVNEITITISAENWAAMLADMEAKYGEMGTGTQGGGMGMRPGNRPEGWESGEKPDFPQDAETTPGLPDEQGTQPQPFEEGAPGNFQPGGAGMGMANTGVDSENPIWVEVTIELNGEVWENVGMRFKGNSSLMQSWSSGDLKMPFKLDFDEFEDTHPEVTDQRFYGFKQLSFSSNFSDESYLHEKVTADLFREAGVPSSQTAFYAISLDTGEGVEYFGLYTAVEVVDDTLIETQFRDDSGNVYKPDGTCATFTAGTYDEACYDKETNQDEADYSDVSALLETLNSDVRLSDPTAWRESLEAVFDVAGFIDYLAVNNVVQNWDTYGVMSHNYYLYNDPETGQLTWIPWDNNMAMQSGMGGGMGFDTAIQNAPQMPQNDDAVENQPGDWGGNRPGGDRGTISLGMDEVTDAWPLIRYLMDDEMYSAMYAESLERVITDVVTEEALFDRFDQYAELIADYVAAEQDTDTGSSAQQSLDEAINALKAHITERIAAAEEYLSSLNE